MSEEELIRYMEVKRQFYSSPEAMNKLKQMVDYMVDIQILTLSEKITTCWTMEILCFTIQTPEGREMYLRLLEHLGKYSPDMAKKYWEIYDNQEYLKERYRQ